MLKEHASLTACSKKVQREVLEEADERLFLGPNNRQVVETQFGKTLESCGGNPFHPVAAQIEQNLVNHQNLILMMFCFVSLKKTELEL